MPEPSFTHDSERLARDYEELSAHRQFEGGQELAEAAGIKAGERVLDVGCGTGLVTEHLCDLVGPTGFVLGLDPLEARIELAKKKARANLAFEVGDARDLSVLADASVDVVFLNAVFHWLPEKQGPLRAFHRVLKKGGRIAISTTPRSEDHGLYRALFGIFLEPPFDSHPRPRDGGTVRVDPDELRALLQETGFTPTLVELRQKPQRYGTPEAVVRFIEASSFGNTFAHLPLELVPLARERMRERLMPLMGPDGIVQLRQRLVAVAMK
jgi:arsenite methyltransferase